MAGKTFSPSKEFVYKQLRGELTFEANMIAHRTSWFVTAQAFFFGSLAIGMSKNEGFADLMDSVYYPIIPLLSLGVCILTDRSVKAAIDSASEYRERLNTFVNDNPGFRPLWHKGGKKTSFVNWGLAKAKFLPWIFGLTWAYILVYPWLSKAFNL